MKHPDQCSACHGSLSIFVGSKNGCDLWQCERCGTVQVKPFPTGTELARLYEAYVGAVDYPKKRASKIRRGRQRIRKLIPKTRGRRFLDVGCNRGFAVAAAAQLGLQAQGIDIDAAAVASCREQFGTIATFDCRTVQEHAALGGKADILYSSEVIEHVPDPEGFVAALHTILAPGGILYLTAPDGGHFTRPKDFTSWAQVIPPEHLSYFTRTGMRQMLERHGFREVRLRLSLKPGLRLTARLA